MDAVLRCKLPGCGGPASGVCINGLSFSECPDVIEVIDANPGESEGDSTDAGAVNQPMVETNGSWSLDVAACDCLLRARGAHLVAVVAGPETGKTTLVATMYELLRRGRMAQFAFAGSETLRGYEERYHLARVATNSGSPDTPRTQRPAGLRFTHLKIQSDFGVRDVIFSDRSGEDFDEALDRPGSISGFHELARADSILMLVDLQKLMEAPHPTKSYLRRLFLSANQASLLNRKEVRLVGTKADLLESEKAEEAREALAQLVDEFRLRADSAVPIEWVVTASRAKAGSTQIGQGLEDILKRTIRPEAISEFDAGASWPKTLSGLDRTMLGYRGAPT